MKKLALIVLLLPLALVAPADAQPAAARAMSAIDIAEGLASGDPALRDRAVCELGLMDEATARSLGSLMDSLDLPEAEGALRRIGTAGHYSCALTACVALDSNEHAIRAAALDALLAVKPAHVHAAGVKHMPAARLARLRQLIAESDYVSLLCQQMHEDPDGELRPPVARAMALMALVDRFFGVKGLGLLVRKLSDQMRGVEAAADKGKTPHRRMLDERVRRGAALWCEAIFIEAPAIKFNYSPIAPFDDRAKAATRIERLLDELEREEVTVGSEDSGRKSFKGKRYGDYLWSLLSDSVSGIQAAAFLRLQWWSGEDVVIWGNGYAEAVERYTNMRKPQRIPARRKIEAWWLSYRAGTE